MIAKSVRSRWVSFRSALLKLLTPLTAKPSVGWPGLLGIWNWPVERTQDHADPRVRIDDAGNVGQTVELVGGVVDRVEARRGILDAAIVVQIIAGDIPVHLVRCARRTRSSAAASSNCRHTSKPPGPDW